MKIIIAGAPASGKGTQCEVIKEKFGVVHLSTGDILRAAVKEGTELGLKAKSFMEAGQLVPDELITNVVCDRLTQDDCRTKGWLLDGFPRTKSQAEALTAAGMCPDAFVLLDVPEKVLVERVTGRRTDPVTGKIYHLSFNPPENEEIAARLIQRSDDTAEKIVVRYREFKSHIENVEANYKDKLVWVDGTQKASEVSAVLLSALQSMMEAQKKEDDENDDSRGGGSGVASRVAARATMARTAIGMASLFAIDKFFAGAFRKYKVNFPSPLGAMIAVFLGLSAVNKASSATADQLSGGLNPAVGFIKSWLPLLFVPPLVVLPLKMYLLAGYEVKMAQLVVAGLVGSVLSSGIFSEALGKLLPAPEGTDERVSPSPAFALPPPVIPSLVALMSLATHRTSLNPAVKALTLKSFGMSSSVASYVASMKLPAKLRSLVHPVLITAALIAGSLSAFAAVNNVPNAQVLAGYFGSGAGAGDLISSFLGTAIVSFGLQLYAYRSMLSRNAGRVLLTTLFSAGFGLYSSALLANSIGLGTTTAYSTLTRCITTPLALSGAALTGADPSLSAFLVVVTGILGASFAEKLLDALNIKDPITVGLSVSNYDPPLFEEFSSTFRDLLFDYSFTVLRWEPPLMDWERQR